MIEITKKVKNKQTKEIFATISEKHGTEHIVLRLQEGLDIKKDEYADKETGLKAQFTVRKTE